MAKLSAKEIRDQFGFSYNQDHAANKGGYSEYGGRDDGAIYSTTNGEYIGTIDNFTPRDGRDDAQGIGRYKTVQDYELSKGYRGDARSDWDSMNDVAGAVQNIYGINKKAAPVPVPPPEPIQLSETVAKAIGRSQAYQDTLMVRDGDYVIGGDESVIDDFNKQTEQNTKEASKPYFERDVNPKDAQTYADKHKLMLGDDFSLTKIA